MYWLESSSRAWIGRLNTRNKRQQTLDYSYYENLGFGKSGHWSNNDLARFLVLDYLERMHAKDFYQTENILTATFQAASLKFEKHKKILHIIDHAYNTIAFFTVNRRNKAKRRKKVLFVTCNKYSSMILAAKKEYDVEMIVEGKKDRLFAIKHLIPYNSYSDLNRLMLAYLTKKEVSSLRELANKVEERIKKVNPDYMVMLVDCLPIERAVVLAGKKLGITTIEIQHGVYHDSFPLETGKVADKVLVWGQYFKDLYVRQRAREPEDMYVLGYPRPIEGSNAIGKNHNPYVVYYLGQDFESYNEKFLNIKVETIKEIHRICNTLGMKFVFRPHPGDRRESLEKILPGIQFNDTTENLEEAFAKGDIFISFQSTALIEAAMRRKISLQLVNYPITSDNFEQLGVCNKTMETVGELEKYLTALVTAPDLDRFALNFNNGYIETRCNPGERFLEILKEIERGNLITSR